MGSEGAREGGRCEGHGLCNAGRVLVGGGQLLIAGEGDAGRVAVDGDGVDTGNQSSFAAARADVGVCRSVGSPGDVVTSQTGQVEWCCGSFVLRRNDGVSVRQRVFELRVAGVASDCRECRQCNHCGDRDDCTCKPWFFEYSHTHLLWLLKDSLVHLSSAAYTNPLFNIHNLV